jgi:hypothetical protein
MPWEERRLTRRRDWEVEAAIACQPSSHLRKKYQATKGDAMVRISARGYSKGISEARLPSRIMSAAIQMINQGRAVMVARIREFGDGCC